MDEAPSSRESAVPEPLRKSRDDLDETDRLLGIFVKMVLHTGLACIVAQILGFVY